MPAKILPNCVLPAPQNNMPHFTTTKRIALTPDQAFAVAADVGSYQEFLPLLKRSVVRGERSKVGDTETFNADLMIAIEKLGLRESFTSHVITDASNRLVSATSSDGLLKSLNAVWKIAATADGRADVTITIDYVLKSKILQLAASGMIDFAAQKIMTAFEQRGLALYGSRLS
jgi:coenzyme Q-binding protein COQ10